MLQFIEIVVAVLGALLVPVLGIAARALVTFSEAQSQRALALVQERLGAAAARIAAELATNARTSPTLPGVTEGMLERGTEQLRERFSDTAARLGIPDETLAGMIAGELGKLGVSVKR
jgi:hypothetical protein